MQSVQCLDTYNDSVVIISGSSVVNSSGAEYLGVNGTVTVKVLMLNVTKNTTEVFDNVPMNYQAAVGAWTIDIDRLEWTISGGEKWLVDGNKYYAKIIPQSGSAFVPFEMHEFIVDTRELELILTGLGYEFRGLGAIGAKQVWLNGTTPVFQALVYEGGSGTQYALRADRVTHRGPIERV